MKRNILILVFVILLILASVCNAGAGSTDVYSPVNIELSIPKINNLDEVSELNVKISNMENRAYPVVLKLILLPSIEYVGESLEFDNNSIYTVWEGQLSENEIKILKFNIKPIAEGEYQMIGGDVSVKPDSNRNFFGSRTDVIYLTITEKDIKVFSKEDLSRIRSKERSKENWSFRGFWQIIVEFIGRLSSLIV